MKLFAKTTAFVCSFLIAASATSIISACAAGNSKQATSSSQTDSSKSETSKLGKVTAINGSEITLALGELTAKQKTSSGEEADTSKKKSSDRSKKKTSDSATSKKNDSADTETDAGSTNKKHKKNRDSSGLFTESGTTVTVKVTDSVSIVKNGTTASVSDIAEGDIVKLEYDDNDNVVKIKISKGHKKTSGTRSRNGKTADSTTEV